MVALYPAKMDTDTKLSVILFCVSILLFFSAVSGRSVYPKQRAYMQQQNVQTCAGAGYIGCCTTGNTNCFVPGGNCFCDITCHNVGDCCDDIDENGCSLSPPMTLTTTSIITTTQRPVTTTIPPPPPVRGTCAGAGYTGCCTTGNTNCFVPEGNCYCDITCHNVGDCCDDIDENGCSIAQPTTQTTPESTIITTTTGMTQHPITTTIPSLLQGTCASAGHINGCCTSGECFVQSGNCFCNVNCHDNHNCCPDIDEIGCVPTTCAEASLDAGCCDWFNESTCHVQGGKCYCDKLCHICGDCCSDVRTNTQCGSHYGLIIETMANCPGAKWTSKLQGYKTKNRATKAIRQKRTLGNNYKAGIAALAKATLSQTANEKFGTKIEVNHFPEVEQRLTSTRN